MSSCKHCKGSGKVPQIDLYGNPIIPQILEICPFCNGSGEESIQRPIKEESNNDQQYGNSLLDWTFNIWRNQNPFEK